MTKNDQKIPKMTKSQKRSPPKKIKKYILQAGILQMLHYSIGVWNPLRTPKTYTNTSKINKKTAQPHFGGAKRPRNVVVGCFFVSFTCVCVCFGGSEGVPDPYRIFPYIFPIYSLYIYTEYIYIYIHSVGFRV